MHSAAPACMRRRREDGKRRRRRINNAYLTRCVYQVKGALLDAHLAAVLESNCSSHIRRLSIDERDTSYSGERRRRPWVPSCLPWNAEVSGFIIVQFIERGFIVNGNCQAYFEPASKSPRVVVSSRSRANERMQMRAGRATLHLPHILHEHDRMPPRTTLTRLTRRHLQSSNGWYDPAIRRTAWHRSLTPQRNQLGVSRVAGCAA